MGCSIIIGLSINFCNIDQIGYAISLSADIQKTFNFGLLGKEVFDYILPN